MTQHKADLLEVFREYPEDMEMLLRNPFDWVLAELEKINKEPPGSWKDIESLVKAMETIKKARV